MRLAIRNIDSPGLLADFLAGTLNLETQQKQDLLEELDVVKRVRVVHHRVSAQLEIAQLQHKIQKDVSSSFTDQQRRAYLREQIKAMQRELGESDEGVEQQVTGLRKRLDEAAPPQSVKAGNKDEGLCGWSLVTDRSFQITVGLFKRTAGLQSQDSPGEREVLGS